jgi:hypothetical protein
MKFLEVVVDELLLAIAKPMFYLLLDNVNVRPSSGALGQ